MTINDTVEVNSNVTLILPDDVTLNVPKGIHVNPGATLSVYGQEKGTGKLIAKGNNAILSNNYYSTTAGIGGKSGTVNIYGGTVKATGSLGQYGIDGTTVNIEGGTVTAKGGDGGGINPNGIHGKNISITGGNVTAVGKGNYGISGTSAITLGWTNYSDSITSNGIYVQGDVTENNYFYMNDTQEVAEWKHLSTSGQFAIGNSASTFTLKPIGDKTVTVDMTAATKQAILSISTTAKQLQSLQHLLVTAISLTAGM